MRTIYTQSLSQANKNRPKFRYDKVVHEDSINYNDKSEIEIENIDQDRDS